MQVTLDRELVEFEFEELTSTSLEGLEMAASCGGCSRCNAGGCNGCKGCGHKESQQQF